MKHYTDRLRDGSRQLRRNQTDAEKALWCLLRAHNLAGFK
jgi:very-short-patch-repair endonuclease